jgi:hypothetical protein
LAETDALAGTRRLPAHSKRVAKWPCASEIHDPNVRSNSNDLFVSVTGAHAGYSGRLRGCNISLVVACDASHR